MEDLLDEPIREGNRGGQGLFKWDDVKADKQREHYLGSSIHANIGRWQRNRVLLWYDKEKNERSAPKDEVAKEIDTIKSAEADALAEALGLEGSKKLSHRLARGGGISQQELKSIIKTQVDGQQEGTAEEPFKKGSGFGYQHALQAGSSVIATSSNAVPVQESVQESKKDKKDKKKKDKKKKKSRRDSLDSSDKESARRHRHSIRSPQRRRMVSEEEEKQDTIKERRRSRSREYRRRSTSRDYRRSSPSPPARRHDSRR